ncbi:hypothetical protein [Thermococcus piezophilus]|uniref:hypothetical protein n=1 Tax=Thermococcus piezophilus TaxID=1712654 RepID=UPI001F27E1F0|nr:hypothetical protein [Thermococcus piezophilus]
MDDARLWLFDKFHGTMNYPLYEAILRFFVRGEISAEEFLNWLELLSTYYGPADTPCTTSLTTTTLSASSTSSVTSGDTSALSLS